MDVGAGAADMTAEPANDHAEYVEEGDDAEANVVAEGTGTLKERQSVRFHSKELERQLHDATQVQQEGHVEQVQHQKQTSDHVTLQKERMSAPNLLPRPSMLDLNENVQKRNSAVAARPSPRGSFLGATRSSMLLTGLAGQIASRRSLPSPRTPRKKPTTAVDIVLGAGGIDNLPRASKKDLRRISAVTGHIAKLAVPKRNSSRNSSRCSSRKSSKGSCRSNSASSSDSKKKIRSRSQSPLGEHSAADGKISPESSFSSELLHRRSSHHAPPPLPHDGSVSSESDSELKELQEHPLEEEVQIEGDQEVQDEGDEPSRTEPITYLPKLRSTVDKVMKLSSFKLVRQRSREKARVIGGSGVWNNSLGEQMMLSQELAGLPIFASCRQGFISELAREVEEVKVGKEQEILQDPSHGPTMLLVLRGSVQVYIDDHAAHKLTRGQYFGESCLLGLEEDWGAKLVSTAASTVTAIRRKSLLTALRFFPQERRFFEGIFQKNKSNMSEGTLVNACAVFRGLSAACICRIDAQLMRRIYFPGEKILEEGKPGDELYILVRGSVNVEIAGRVVREERRDSRPGLERTVSGVGHPHDDAAESDNDGDSLPVSRTVSAKKSSDSDSDSSASEDQGPVCFGELGLLGMQEVRTATVVVQSVCHVRVLYRDNFLKTLQSNSESLQMEQMRGFFENRYKDNHRAPPKKVLQEVKIFKEVGCSDSFLDFLAQHLEDRIFLSGQKIIDETVPDDRCMYLLAQGLVKVLKENKEVATLTSGAVFGEIIVLGLASKRSATVVAAETCYMQVLHQSVVVRGLELFPDERRKVLMMAFTSPGMDKEEKEATSKAVSTQTGGRQSTTHKAFLKALKNSPLFENMSPSFVEELSHVSQDRIYMPGDLIIEEGKRGDSMFILVSGTATVFVSDPDNVTTSVAEAPSRGPADEEVMVNGDRLGKSLMITEATRLFKKKSMSRIGVLTAGSISGELAMLGVSTIRSATIEASTICSMWEITQEKALSILECFPDAQKHFADIIVTHLERTVPARILSLPLFRGFDRKFRMLLGLYCDRQAYFPGQMIAGEGKPGDRLFVVNQGRATLEKKGVTVKTYAAGSHFGSTVMLGVHKVYLGSLLALQTCHVLIVSRTSYQQALEQYPALIAAQELKRSEKAAVEELREAIQRISTRKLIWKRYQCQLLDVNDPDNKKLTDSELLERALKSWCSRTKQLLHQRRHRETERKKSVKMMQDWVQKKRDAWERLQIKKLQQEGGWPVFADDGSRLATREGKQRPVSVHAATPRSAELAGVLQDWPAPRPSPHYRLRVFGVLYEAAQRPSTGAPLLPLLNTRGAQGITSKEQNRGALKERSKDKTLESRGTVRLALPTAEDHVEVENDDDGEDINGSRRGSFTQKRLTLRSSTITGPRLSRKEVEKESARKNSGNPLEEPPAHDSAPHEKVPTKPWWNSSFAGEVCDGNGDGCETPLPETYTNPGSAGSYGYMAEADFMPPSAKADPHIAEGPWANDLEAAGAGRETPPLSLRGAAPRSIDESLLSSRSAASPSLVPLVSTGGGAEPPATARGSSRVLAAGSGSSVNEASIVLPKLERTSRISGTAPLRSAR